MLRRLVPVVFAFTLPGCGGNSSTPTNTTPPTTMPPCTQSVVFQDSGPLPSESVLSLAFSTSAAGRLDVTVDWTFAASTIGIYLVQGSCELEQFNARTCTFLIRSETGAKPRRVSASTSGAGNYELLIANFGSMDESGTAQVVLSSANCPAFAVASTSTDGPPISNRTLTRLLRR